MVVAMVMAAGMTAVIIMVMGMIVMMMCVTVTMRMIMRRTTAMGMARVVNGTGHGYHKFEIPNEMREYPRLQGTREEENYRRSMLSDG